MTYSDDLRIVHTFSGVFFLGRVDFPSDRWPTVLGVTTPCIATKSSAPRRCMLNRNLLLCLPQINDFMKGTHTLPWEISLFS